MTPVLDIAGGQTLGVQGEDFLIEAVEPALRLGDPLRLEGALAITRRVEGEFPTIAANGFLGVAVAAVGGSGLVARVTFNDRRLGRDDRASEMHIHFGIEHAFHGGFRQGAPQLIEVFERFGLVGAVADELLRLELEGRVHA